MQTVLFTSIQTRNLIAECIISKEGTKKYVVCVSLFNIPPFKGLSIQLQLIQKKVNPKSKTKIDETSSNVRRGIWLHVRQTVPVVCCEKANGSFLPWYNPPLAACPAFFRGRGVCVLRYFGVECL